MSRCNYYLLDFFVKYSCKNGSVYKLFISYIEWIIFIINIEEDNINGTKVALLKFYLCTNLFLNVFAPQGYKHVSHVHFA